MCRERPWLPGTFLRTATRAPVNRRTVAVIIIDPPGALQSRGRSDCGRHRGAGPALSLFCSGGRRCRVSCADAAHAASTAPKIIFKCEFISIGLVHHGHGGHSSKMTRLRPASIIGAQSERATATAAAAGSISNGPVCGGWVATSHGHLYPPSKQTEHGGAATAGAADTTTATASDDGDYAVSVSMLVPTARSTAGISVSVNRNRLAKGTGAGQQRGCCSACTAQRLDSPVTRAEHVGVPVRPCASHGSALRGALGVGVARRPGSRLQRHAQRNDAAFVFEPNILGHGRRRPRRHEAEQEGRADRVGHRWLSQLV